MVLVKNIMSKSVITVFSSTTVADAAVLMKKSKVGSLVVVDTSGSPIGIVTESDILFKIVAEKKSLDTQINQILTKDLKTISKDDSIEKAAKIMAAHRIRRLPVIEGKELIGIVTLKDLVKAKKVNSDSEYYPYFT